MNFDEYQKASMRSFRPKTKLDPFDEKALLGAIGLAGEAGECLEPIKKMFFHQRLQKEGVKETLREELGDVLWYVACVADAFGLRLDDIANYNVEKLLARYPERKE